MKKLIKMKREVERNRLFQSFVFAKTAYYTSFSVHVFRRLSFQVRQ